MKAEKEALERALKRFTHQKMYAAWHTWRDWAAEMRRQRYIMHGAVERMLLAQLNRAFNKWETWRELAQILAKQEYILRGQVV